MNADLLSAGGSSSPDRDRVRRVPSKSPVRDPAKSSWSRERRRSAQGQSRPSGWSSRTLLLAAPERPARRPSEDLEAARRMEALLRFETMVRFHERLYLWLPQESA
jgi:hypothetical protein